MTGNINDKRQKNLVFFQTGQTGNPKGRPPIPGGAKAVLKRLKDYITDEDIEKVTKIIRDKAARGDRWAMEQLLDRTEGKPAVRAELTGAGGAALMPPTIVMLDGAAAEQNRMLIENLKIDAEWEESGAGAGEDGGEDEGGEGKDREDGEDGDGRETGPAEIPEEGEGDPP